MGLLLCGAVVCCGVCGVGSFGYVGAMHSRVGNGPAQWVGSGGGVGGMVGGQVGAVLWGMGGLCWVVKEMG